MDHVDNRVVDHPDHRTVDHMNDHVMDHTDHRIVGRADGSAGSGLLRKQSGKPLRNL